MNRNQTELNVLPAYNGDSLLIKTYDENNAEFIILVDGGTMLTFEYSLKKQLKEISKIDLLILTHIDCDHIGGLIKFFKSTLIAEIEINEIWYNQPDIDFYQTNAEKAIISIRQAEDWKALIKDKKLDVVINEISTEKKKINKKGLEFIILSPTSEIKNIMYETWLKEREKPKSTDLNTKVLISNNVPSYSKSLEELNRIAFRPEKSINNDVYNSSSVAFVLKCLDLSLLLLADSRAEVISESLRELGYNESKPIKVDFVKVSHHGSLNNTSQELLSLIESNNYIISTNGGSSNHKHPSRETIARIIYKSNNNDDTLNIYTNYSVDSLRSRIGDFITSDDFKIGNWNIVHKNIFTKNDL